MSKKLIFFYELASLAFVLQIQGTGFTATLDYASRSQKHRGCWVRGILKTDGNYWVDVETPTGVWVKISNSDDWSDCRSRIGESSDSLVENGFGYWKNGFWAHTENDDLSVGTTRDPNNASLLPDSLPYT